MRILISLLALIVFGAASALAANPEPFTVQMTVRQAITITNTAPLDFGTVDVNTGLQTVAAAAAGHTAGAGAAAATFNVVGENLAIADVSFVTNPINIGNGTDTVAVTMTLASATHTFDGATQVLYVGGSLTVGAISAGSYVDAGNASLQMVYQ